MGIILPSCSNGVKKNDSERVLFPSKPVKVIVPFSPGGGSDSFARVIQRAVADHHLLPENLVVINVPGAGGTEGSRRVLNAYPDGHTLLFLHDGILTAKYSGNAAYGPEAFQPIAATGRDTMIIGVPADSPYASLGELMEAAAQSPDTVTFATNFGAPSHFAALLLEKAEPGAQFRFVQAGGGSKRLANLIGGHVDVSAFSVAEYLQFKSEGLRALATLGESRDAAAPDVPAAREQGYDLISGNMHFWWAPKGTDPARVARIAEALQQALQTEDVKAWLDRLHTEPVFLTGGDLESELERREARIAAVATRDTVSVPDFPLWAGVVVLVLGTALITRRFLASRKTHSSKTADDALSGPAKQPPASNPELSIAKPFFLFLLALLYALSLQGTWPGYRIATGSFLLAAGWLLLTPRRLRNLAVVVALAGVLSLGSHYVFTHVLTVDLP